MIPIAGSAYTYSYATMGELMAWIIGWDLVLEYAVGAATVAIAWSQYFNRVLGFVRVGHTVAVVPLALPGHAGTGANGVAAVNGIMNVPAVVHPVPAHAAADPRHAAVGVRQQPDRRPQGLDRADGDRAGLGLHQPGEPHAVHSRADARSRTPQGITHDYGGIMGILGAAGVVFFALHRVRRGLDRRAGSEEPEAGHADRHPRVRSPICTVLYVLFA